MGLSRRWIHLLLMLGSSAAFGAPADLPYCQFAATIDGHTGEWREPWLRGEIVETAGEPAQRNRVQVRACWDLDGLLLGASVTDSDLLPAPPGLDVDRFHQYDSLQVYIDTRGDAGARMNDDDVDVLLLPDGRSGTLRGDSLIGELAGAAVPQRAAAPLQVDYATTRTADGWGLELRVPFLGLGLEPRAGHRLGLDLAMNDWLVDHPPGESEALTPERVRKLAARDVPLPEPDAAVGTQLLPRTWSGDNDFGYPSRWRPLVLAGGPGRWEILRREMDSGTLLAIGLAGLALGLGCAAAVHFWHRRRLRELLARMARSAPDSPTPAPEQAGAEPAPVADSPVPVAPSAPPEPEDRADAGRDREFAERVLAHVRQRLAQPLSPVELADAFHVSLRTLQRRLKAGLDTSPQDLVLAARLEAARELLREGRWRVGEVAARVGFDDLSHFSRRYRQAYGHPPSAETASPRDL